MGYLLLLCLGVYLGLFVEVCTKCARYSRPTRKRALELRGPRRACIWFVVAAAAYFLFGALWFAGAGDIVMHRGISVAGQPRPVLPDELRRLVDERYSFTDSERLDVVPGSKFVVRSDQAAISCVVDCRHAYKPWKTVGGWSCVERVWLTVDGTACPADVDEVSKKPLPDPIKVPEHAKELPFTPPVVTGCLDASRLPLRSTLECEAGVSMAYPELVGEDGYLAKSVTLPVGFSLTVISPADQALVDGWMDYTQRERIVESRGQTWWLVVMLGIGTLASGWLVRRRAMSFLHSVAVAIEDGSLSPL